MTFSQIKAVLADHLSQWLILIIVVFNIGLFLLWHYLIQSQQLPIYTPITIFPVQFSIIIAFINTILAFAIGTKSIRICHLLLSSSIIVSILLIIMVIYSYNFFKI